MHLKYLASNLFQKFGNPCHKKLWKLQWDIHDLEWKRRKDCAPEKAKLRQA